MVATEQAQLATIRTEQQNRRSVSFVDQMAKILERPHDPH